MFVFMVENQHFAWDLGHLFKSLLQFLTTTEILSYAENPAPTLIFAWLIIFFVEITAS